MHTQLGSSSIRLLLKDLHYLATLTGNHFLNCTQTKFIT